MSINNKVGYEIDVSSVDAATAKIKSFSDTMSQTGTAGQAALAKVETSSGTATGAMTKFQQSVEKTKGSMGSAAIAVTGLAANMASLYFSFDQLDRSVVRVEQSHLRLEKAQQLVDKLQKEQKTHTDEYANAMQNLSIQQQRYDLAQQQVTENMVFMSLSVVTLATSSIPAAIKAVQALQVTQEAFAVTLEATMPWLLAITAALLAWEYVVAPLIKQHTNLDLGIQSNITKLVAQHQQVSDNTAAMDQMTNTYGVADGAISATAGTFDQFGNSVTGVTSKLTEMEQAFQDIKNNDFLSPTLKGGESLLSKNDVFSQLKDQLTQAKAIESDIQTIMDDGKDKQTAINIVMDHYLLQLQEERDSLHESNDQYQRKVDLLTQAGAKAKELLDTTKQQTAEDKKKQQLISDLAKTTGLSEALITASFNLGGAGVAFNPGLQNLWMQGLRNFGSQFVASAVGQQLGMFGARPFYEGTGYSMSNSGGVNTSSTVGGLHNNDMWNKLVDIIANQHMFGTGLFVNVKDFNRQAVENGEARAESMSEASSPLWQKFYALKRAGLFNGDPNLSIELNLERAAKQYDAIFAPLRSDVAAQLQALHTSTYQYLTGDNRRGTSIVTNMTYSLPTLDEMKRAIADSLFASEKEFQADLKELEQTFTLTSKQVIDALQTPDGQRDFENMLAFKNLPKIKGLAT